MLKASAMNSKGFQKLVKVIYAAFAPPVRRDQWNMCRNWGTNSALYHIVCIGGGKNLAKAWILKYWAGTSEK